MKNWIGHNILLVVVCFSVVFGIVFIVQNQFEIQELHTIIEQTAPVEKASTSVEKASTSVELNISKHSELVKRAEEVAGTQLSRIANLIIREEGVRSVVYVDKVGKPTIGVGRSLATNGLSLAELVAITPNPNLEIIVNGAEVRNGRIYLPNIQVAHKVLPEPLTKDDIHLLLADDLKNVVKEAKQVFKNWGTIDEPRREALLDLLFNLGLTHFKTFEDFIASVQAENWNDAARELLLSVAARQNPTRYVRNMKVIETGNAKYFDL